MRFSVLSTYVRTYYVLIKKFCSVLNNINDYSYVQADMILYLTILMNTQERRCHQLLKAAEFGYVGVVKTLIDKKYIDVNSRNDVSNYIYVTVSAKTNHVRTW